MVEYAPMRLLGLGLMALALAGCSLAPDYVRPAAPIPPTVSASTAFGEERILSLRWEEFYTDERLRSLIRTSLAHNRDVRLAALAVAEAAATYGVQRSERFPQADASASGTFSGTFQGEESQNYEPRLRVSFSLDLFGRLKSLNAAALEQYLASAQAEQAVRLTLMAQVAQAYIDESLALERREVAAQNLESWQHSLAFIERRLQSGQSSLLELEQANSMVQSATAALAERDREVILAGNALSLLLGSYEEGMLPPRQELASLTFAPLPSSLPSAVLLSRPDVMEAEHNLRAANADIGAARAAFFPEISLTGSLGSLSDDLGRLFMGASGFWNFVPSIAMPLFTAGRNRANLELAQLREEQAVAQYEKTIQTAFREVADALQTSSSYARQLEAQERYLDSLHTVASLAMSQYANGTVSYLEVLDAQRNMFQARQEVLILRRDLLANAIQLFTAMGGGLSPVQGMSLHP